MKKQNFLKRLGIKLFLGWVLVLCLGFTSLIQGVELVPTAYAEDPPQDENKPNEQTYEQLLEGVDPVEENANNAQTTKDIMQDVAKAATKAHRFFAPLINLASFQIGNFLSNDYIYQGSMGMMLHKIWIISRNLVNIVLVFYLLWLAVKTIILPESGWDELKKSLAKFVLALIVVNFSWLATKVVLDAASIATHAVFAIPSGIGDPPKYEPCVVNTNAADPIQGVCYPTKIIAPADIADKPVLYWQDTEGEDDNCSKVEKGYTGTDNADDINISAYNSDGTINDVASDENKKLQGRISICMESLNLFKYDQNTAVIYLTYGMARIQNLVNASASGGDGLQLAIGTLMSIVLQIVYAIALLALFVALIVRMMMLWILVGFSPFIILVMGMSGEGADAGDLGKQFSVENFLSWALVPVKVGVIFVVAFIMISAGQAMGNISEKVLDNLAKESGFTFKLLGQESLFAGLGSLQDFVWLLMTIAVLWMGVFAVLGKLEIVGSWFNRIGETGKELAISAAKLPYILPWIPKGQGQWVSPKSALGTVTGLTAATGKYEGLMSGTSSTRMSRNIDKLNFKELNQRFQNGQFKIDDANKMARDLGYNNLSEMMKEDPNHIREQIDHMPGAKDHTSTTRDAFYKQLVDLNEGKVGLEGSGEGNTSGTGARATTGATASVGGGATSGAAAAGSSSNPGGVKDDSSRGAAGGSVPPPKSPGSKEGAKDSDAERFKRIEAANKALEAEKIKVEAAKEELKKAQAARESVADKAKADAEIATIEKKVALREAEMKVKENVVKLESEKDSIVQEKLRKEITEGEKKVNELKKEVPETEGK